MNEVIALWRRIAELRREEVEILQHMSALRTSLDMAQEADKNAWAHFWEDGGKVPPPGDVDRIQCEIRDLHQKFGELETEVNKLSTELATHPGVETSTL